jgi:hypothetical protein
MNWEQIGYYKALIFKKVAVKIYQATLMTSVSGTQKIVGLPYTNHAISRLKLAMPTRSASVRFFKNVEGVTPVNYRKMRVECPVNNWENEY